MKYIICFLFGSLLISGCELFVIGGKNRKPVIEVNQKSPIGTIFLFKNELDSNNIAAAIRLMKRPGGTPLLAIEKYELYDELRRISRLIALKPVTSFKTDSLSETSYKVNVEFDYLKTISFTTTKISDDWYIVSYQE